MLTKAKNRVVEFLNKVIGNGKTKFLKAKDFVKHIFCASSHNTYVETISNKADSLHRNVKNSYEEDIITAYQEVIKSLVKYKRFGLVTIAIDETKEQFYGETRNFHIFHRDGNHESKAEFHFLVISIVNSNGNIPLMALPVTLGCDRAKLIEKLLSFAKKLLRIKLVLLDRDFGSAEIIHTLRELNLNYLIFAKKCESYECMLESVKNSAILEHEMSYNKNKSKIKINTNLVLIKEQDYDWCFYTNLYLNNARFFIHLYKKRWQIETNFRVEDEAKIKSKSTNYLIRYFYFMISLLLHAIWIIFSSNPFKLFLIRIYEQFLNQETVNLNQI